MKKSIPFLVALALFSAVFFILFHFTDRASPIPDVVNDAPVDYPAEGQGTSVGQPGTHRPEHPSPPSWRPPQVFAKTGQPTPQHVFPRGENATRRHHEPANREIQPELSAKRPTVLAKSPDDGRFHLLPEELDDHALAARRMVFDPTALGRIIDGKTSRLLAPTPSDEFLLLEFKKIKTRSSNTHTLQGHVVGEESTSIAQIVYHDGILHGSVMRYGTNQEIEYRILADGHMMVRELDHSNMTDNCATCKGFMADMEQDEFPDAPVQTNSPDGDIIAYDTPGWRVIDVVVGYSQEARILDGGYSQIEARIMDSLDRMTLAFANSQIANTEMMLVGTIEDPAYVAPGTSSASLGDELINLRNESDGVLDTVTNLSNRLGADLVSFVTPAGQGGQSGVANGGNRYTINSRTSMTASQMVFAHELGHNMGTGHAWGDSSKTTAANTGWRLKTQSGAQVSTIMAYTDGWGARITANFSSSVPGNSTPGRIVVAGGATFGILGGSYGSIDNLLSNATWSDKTSRLGFMLVGGTSSTFSTAITQELSVHKYGSSSGALTLTGNSSYTGHTIISQGILAFNSIANVGGGNSALGAPATVAFGTIALGADGSAVTLRYTGTGHSTDRVINLAGTTGSATLDMSGTNTLTFTSALTATGAGIKTLTLTGSTTGIGVLGGAIVNNSGTNLTSLSKTGTGTWVILGANTYTGTTTISGGTLELGADNCLANTTNVVIGGATLKAADNVNDSVGTLDVTAPTTINLGSGATLAFSGATATWAGTLNITGTFLSGNNTDPGNPGSLRFGTTNTGLTAAQLAKITASGWTNFGLDSLGYLTAAPIGSNTFAIWIAGFSVGGQTGINGDFDNDDIGNAVENLMGTSPAAFNQGLTAVSSTGGNLKFRHTLSTTASSDLTGAYEWSVNLSDWNASGVPSGGTTVTFGAPVVITAGTPNLVEVTATVAGTPSSKIFARFKATQP